MSLEAKSRTNINLPAEKIALAYLLLALTGIILSSLFFPVWGWGLSLLRGFPPFVWVFFTLFSLLGTIPLLRKSLAWYLDPPFKDNKSQGARGFLLPIALAGALLAFIFTVPCPIMGDGIDYVYNFSFHREAHRHYPLFSMFISGIYRLTALFFGESPSGTAVPKEVSYFIWSVVCGIGTGIFLAGIIKLSSLLSDKRKGSYLPALLVLCSGTMVLFSGYIEVTVLFNSLMVVFFAVVFRQMEGRGSPWPVFMMFFLCLGMHVSSIALAPPLVWYVLSRRKEVSKEPVRWFLAFAVTLTAFLLAVNYLVGIKQFALQFLSGTDALSVDNDSAKTKMAYGIFSLTHLLEFANVLSLHNPLNILFLVWIAYGLIKGWGKVNKDRMAVFLLLATGSFLVEFYLLNAFLGIFRDWEIFSPLGILLPLTAYRVWRSGEGYHWHLRIGKAAAILLPLSLAQLILWQIIIHNPDRLLKSMVEYVEKGGFLSADGVRYLGSNLSIYCVGENYYPDYLVDFLGSNEEARRYIIYRLCSKRNMDKLLEFTEKWSDKMTSLDYANVGGALLYGKQYESSIYYLRLGWRKNFKEPLIAYNLAAYYMFANLPHASLYYYMALPEDRKELLKRNYSLSWNYEPRSIEEAKKLWTLILPNVAGNIFDSGMRCLEKGYFESGELELLTALSMGYDSLNVYQRLGEYSIAGKKWDKAEMYYRKLWEMNPGEWKYLLGTGLACAYGGKKEEALRIAGELSASGAPEEVVGTLKKLIEGQ